MKKSAQRDANTARAAGCSKVRTPPARPSAVTNPQTGPITIHCAAKLSAQCNDDNKRAAALKINALNGNEANGLS